LSKFFWLNRIVETRSSNLIQDCAAGNKSAERELGAFLAAVTELFGADQARRTAEDWLDELELQETFPGEIDWRPITVAAADSLKEFGPSVWSPKALAEKRKTIGVNMNYKNVIPFD